MTAQVNLTGGPSKFDLMTALFVMKPNRTCVQFKTKLGQLINALIDGVDIEDGSGESWCIRGHGSFTTHATNRRFEGYFNTQTRTGYLKFVD